MSDRSLKFVLVASLVFNAFLLGGIAGGAYQWFAAHDHARHAPPRTALRFAADELSPQRQREFVEALRAARMTARADARAGREGRRDVLSLLAAPQLDRAALDAALARTRAADSALRAQVESGVADFAATLTPEERLRFADGLREAGQWRQPKPPGKRRAPQ
jgi:uncharacterized membrane protein